MDQDAGMPIDVQGQNSQDPMMQQRLVDMICQIWTKEHLKKRLM